VGHVAVTGHAGMACRRGVMQVSYERGAHAPRPAFPHTAVSQPIQTARPDIEMQTTMPPPPSHVQVEGCEGGDWGAAWLSAFRCLGVLFGWVATRLFGGRRDVAHARSAGPKLLHRIPAQPTPDRCNCATLVGKLHDTTPARHSSMSRYGHMSHTDTADSAPDVRKQCSQCFICIVHGDPK